MNIKSNEEMLKIIAKDFETGFIKNITDSNDSHKFIAWYLKFIQRLEEEDIASSITDGKNDLGIDSIYIDDEDQTVLIIQSKYYKGKPSNKTVVADLQLTIENYKDLEKQCDRANENIRSKMPEIRIAKQKNYFTKYVLLISNELTSEAKKDFDNLAARCDGESCSVALVDINVLRNEYNSCKNDLGGVEFKHLISNGDYIYNDANSIKYAILILDLKDAANIDGIEDQSIFAPNVRKKLKKTGRPNQKMMKTIRDNPNYFFYYNNGITAVCDSIVKKNNYIIAENLGVVNGCQTLTTIYLAIKGKNEDINGKVLFKIYASKDNELKINISEYTNSQTAVNAMDLKSNSDELKEIKRKYEEEYQDEQLIIKTGDIEIKQIIHDRLPMVKYISSYYALRPDKRDKGYLFSDDIFEKIFKNINIYTPRDIHGLFRLETFVKKFIKENKNKYKENETRLALIGKFDVLMAYITMCFSYLFMCYKNNNNKFIYPRILNDIPEGTITYYIEMIFESISNVFDNESNKTKGIIKWLDSIENINKVKLEINRINTIGKDKVNELLGLYLDKAEGNNLLSY